MIKRNYSSKGGNIDYKKLSTCISALLQLSCAANYRCNFLKLGKHPYPSVSSPDGHGFLIGDQGLHIDWNNCLSAPQEVTMSKFCFVIEDVNNDFKTTLFKMSYLS